MYIVRIVEFQSPVLYALGSIFSCIQVDKEKLIVRETSTNE